MITQDDPFAVIGAAQFRDDVVERALLIIHHQLHVRDGCAGPDVIGKRQAALPLARDVRAAEIREDCGSVLRIDGHSWNVRKIRGVGGREALGIGSCGHSRRERVAGINLCVFHGAALDAGHGAPGAVGEHVARNVAVVFGIGINNEGQSLVLFSEFCFDAAIAAAVASDCDFSGDADSQLFELAIIRLHAVIHIDDGAVTSPDGEKALKPTTIFLLKVSGSTSNGCSGVARIFLSGAVSSSLISRGCASQTL